MWWRAAAIGFDPCCWAARVWLGCGRLAVHCAVLGACGLLLRLLGGVSGGLAVLLGVPFSSGGGKRVGLWASCSGGCSLFWWGGVVVCGVMVF